MSKVKGCINIQCVAKHKEIRFKEDDSFCSKCGQELVYVCEKCHEPVEEPDKKYCLKCQEEIDRKKEQRKEKMDKAVEVAGKAKDVAVVAVPMVAKVADKLPVPPAVKPCIKVVDNAAKVVKK